MLTPVDRLDHATVRGGMNLDGVPASTDIDDRRGLTPSQSLHAKSPPAPPLPPLVRTPGDLASQAGLDDITKNIRPPKQRR